MARRRDNLEELRREFDFFEIIRSRLVLFVTPNLIRETLKDVAAEKCTLYEFRMSLARCFEGMTADVRRNLSATLSICHDPEKTELLTKAYKGGFDKLAEDLRYNREVTYGVKGDVVIIPKLPNEPEYRDKVIRGTKLKLEEHGGYGGRPFSDCYTEYTERARANLSIIHYLLSDDPIDAAFWRKEAKHGRSLWFTYGGKKLSIAATPCTTAFMKAIIDERIDISKYIDYLFGLYLSVSVSHLGMRRRDFEDRKAEIQAGIDKGITKKVIRFC